MSDFVSNVVEQRNKIDQLFQQSSRGKLLNKAKFLTWSDELRPIVSSERAIPDSDVVQSWDNIQDAISRNASFAKKISNKKKNPLGFFFVPQSYQLDGPDCPNTKEISKRLAEETLIPLVYNYQGYSFTSEFNMVYKGTFSHVTAYEDLLTIIRKALLSTDPAISNDICEQYAIYIVTQTAWDTVALADIFKQYVHSRFPNISKFELKAEEVGLNTRIYIGKSYSGHISFTVRSECFANFSDSTIQKNEVIVPIPLTLYHDHDIASFDSIREFLNRLQYISTETDVVRASAAKIKFASSFPTNELRFYVKVNLSATPSTEPGVSQQNQQRQRDDVDSDLSDDDDDDDIGTSNFTFDGIELDALAPAPAYCSINTSFAGELYGWGYDSFYSLGVGNASRSQSEGNAKSDVKNADVAKLLDEVYEPRPIPISRNIALEQVRMITCSSRHSIMLTQFGGLYATGDNAEGALGLGDMYPRNVFTLIDWSVQLPSGKKITNIACGAGVAGAHSMAIDSEGLLYGWGFTKAIGRGTVQPTLTPQAIPIPAHADTEFDDELMDGLLATQQRDSATGTRRRPPSERERERDTGLTNEDRRRRRMVRTVACGAGFTICVMMSGEVYAFGQWAHGRLGLGEIPKMSVRGRGLRSTPKLARYQLRPVRLLEIENAISVACGDAHVLCLLASGHVLTWGQNALGQLGIGPMRTGLLKDQFLPVLLPPFGASLKSGTPGMQKYNQHLMRRFVLVGAGPRYQRRLQYLFNDNAASFHAIKGQQVVCGAYHSIVMDRNNHVWTWGARGSPCLGHADSKILGDWSQRVSQIFSVATNESEVMIPFELLAWCNLWSTPRRVRAFDTYYSSRGAHSNKEQLSTSSSYYYDDYALVDQQYQQVGTTNTGNEEIEDATDDSAGNNMALDDDMTIISNAYDQQQQQSTSNTRDNSSQRLKIMQVVAGDLHTLFITNHGRLYLCGSGPAVPPLFPSDLDLDSAVADLKNKKNTKQDLDVSVGKDRAVVVHSPRCPSAQWLAPVCMRAVRYVSSGGCRIFALFDEETVSLNLSSKLYRSLRAPAVSAMHPTSSTGEETSDDETSKSGIFSLLSGASGLLSDYSHILLHKGRVDCMVIASGYTFVCHRALLAKRSPELRDMILLETPTDGEMTSSDSLTQILLPELHKDTARVLCYFLYTDTLPKYVLGQRVLLHALSRCGQTLKLPRLQLLAERLLALLQVPHSLNDIDGMHNLQSDESIDTTLLDELPPPTLSRDLGNMLGDPDFADVRFIAEGRSVAAHRFILESRCPYFRAMFQSNFAETASINSAHKSGGATQASNLAQQRIVDVVVPDSFVGFLRLLIFIYTDTLPDGSDGALLEDLMAADRYMIMIIIIIIVYVFLSK